MPKQALPLSPKRYRMLCHTCGLATQNPAPLVCDEDDTLIYYLECRPSHDDSCVHAGEGEDGDCRDYPKPSLWTGLTDAAGREVYEFDVVAIPWNHVLTGQAFALGAVLWKPESAGFLWLNEHGHPFQLAHQLVKGYVVGSVFDDEAQLFARAKELLGT